MANCTEMELYEFKSLSRVVSTSKLAPDLLTQEYKQPIRSQVSKLTKLLTQLQLTSFNLR